ncbi:MAG: c-type cytochrome, partial [Muriicola sp.]|nr:c-type cytochrome [Muriicola sp.]NNK36383.1 c-type cytochrome [Eudoraea sp.]
MKTIKQLLILGVISLSLYSFTDYIQEKWVVPEKYVNMKNPTNPDVDLDIGKSLYNQHCKSCHGKEGYGDGPKAAEMTGDLGDFSSQEFQAQT